MTCMNPAAPRVNLQEHKGGLYNGGNIILRRAPRVRKFNLRKHPDRKTPLDIHLIDRTFLHVCLVDDWPGYQNLAHL